MVIFNSYVKLPEGNYDDHVSMMHLWQTLTLPGLSGLVLVPGQHKFALNPAERHLQRETHHRSCMHYFHTWLLSKKKRRTGVPHVKSSMKFSYHSKLLPAVAFATARRPHDAPACPQVHERSKQTKFGLNKLIYPPQTSNAKQTLKQSSCFNGFVSGKLSQETPFFQDVQGKILVSCRVSHQSIECFMGKSSLENLR